MKKILLILAILAANFAPIFAEENPVFPPIDNDVMEKWQITPAQLLRGNEKISQMSLEEVRESLRLVAEMNDFVTAEFVENWLLLSAGTLGDRKKIADKIVQKIFAGTPIPPAGTRLSKDEIFHVIRATKPTAEKLPKSLKDYYIQAIEMTFRCRHNQPIPHSEMSPETLLKLPFDVIFWNCFLGEKTELSEGDLEMLQKIYVPESTHTLISKIEALAQTPAGKALRERGIVPENPQKKAVPALDDEEKKLVDLHSHWRDVVKFLRENPGVPASDDDYKKLAELAKMQPLSWPAMIECAKRAENWDDAAYFQYLWLRELPFGAGTQNAHWQKLFWDLMNFYANGGNAREFFVCAGFCEEIGLDFPRERENALAGTRNVEAAKIDGFVLATKGFYENLAFENRFVIRTGNALEMRKSLRNLVQYAWSVEKMRNTTVTMKSAAAAVVEKQKTANGN